MSDYTHATVHTGPKGGTEYRLWTVRDTFRVVGRYAAWPYLSESERIKAETMERERKDAKRQQAEADAAWRSIGAARM